MSDVNLKTVVSAISVPFTSKYELINTSAVANVSSVAFTGLSSNYAEHILICSNVFATSATFLLLRTSTNNGGSYSAGAADYTYNRTRVDDTETVTNSSIETSSISIGQVVGSTNYGHYLKVSMMNIGVTDQFCASWDNGYFISTSYRDVGIGFRKSTTAVNAIQISGTEISGTFRLYGVKE